MSPRVAYRILLGAAVLSLALFAWLARYAHPMGDDWSYARMGIDHHLLPWLKDQYFTWNGRYFSNILVGSSPLMLGLEEVWLYRTIPLLLILLTWWSYHRLVAALLNGAAERPFVFAGGLLFTALYFHGMPDIGEGLYWYTGAVTYLIGTVLLLVHLSLFAGHFRGDHPLGRTVHVLLELVTAIAVVGSSEVHMLLLVGIHAIALVVHWRRGRRPDGREWAAVAVVLCCAAFMYMAPGNAVRSSYFDTKHEFWRSLGWSILQTARFGLEWIWVLAIPSLLYIPLSRSWAERYAPFRNAFGFTPLGSTVALAGVIFLCVFPAYWNTGILGQHRTVNVAYAFFLPLWFINLTAWANRPPRMFSRAWFIDFVAYTNRSPRLFSRQRPHWMTSLGLALVSIALIVSHNGGRAMEDLTTGTAAAFDAQMTARYALIEASRASQGPIELPPITAKPEALYLYDITDDPTFWANRAYGLYFDLRDRPFTAAAQRKP